MICSPRSQLSNCAGEKINRFETSNSSSCLERLPPIVNLPRWKRLKAITQPSKKLTIISYLMFHCVSHPRPTKIRLGKNCLYSACCANKSPTESEPFEAFSKSAAISHWSQSMKSTPYLRINSPSRKGGKREIAITKYSAGLLHLEGCFFLVSDRFLMTASPVQTLTLREDSKLNLC